MVRRLSCSLGLLALVLVSAPSLDAQLLRLYGTDFLPPQSPPGQLIEVTVYLVEDGVEPVLGWSFGVSISGPPNALISVEPTPLVATVNGGLPPEFQLIDLLPDGFTVQTLICTSPCTGLDTPSSWNPLYDIVVEPLIVEGELDFCTTGALGTPPVPLEVTTPAGTVTPQIHCHRVCVTTHQEWEYSVTDLSVPYDRLTGEVSFDVTVNVGQFPCGFPTIDSPGLAMGLGHDPTLLTATGGVPAPPLMALNGGSGPDFFQVDIYPEGVTLGMVVSFIGSESMQYPGETPTLLIAYDSVPTLLTGAVSPIDTPLEWRDDLGLPPVTNVILPGDGAQVPDALIDGLVTLVPVDATLYIRGDIQEDGTVDLADAVALLAYLFSGGPPPGCAEAGDINIDATIDIGDPICILGFLFSGGHPPHAPFPDCGYVAPDDCPTDSAACP